MWRAQTKPQHLAVMERPDEPGGYRCAADEMRRMVSVTKVDEDVLLLKRVILIWDRLICEIKALVCTGMCPNG